MIVCIGALFICNYASWPDNGPNEITDYATEIYLLLNDILLLFTTWHIVISNWCNLFTMDHGMIATTFSWFGTPKPRMPST